MTETLTHAYPTTRVDPVRLTPGLVVCMPVDGCYYCERDTCVQTREGDIVTHQPMGADPPNIGTVVEPPGAHPPPGADALTDLVVGRKYQPKVPRGWISGRSTAAADSPGADDMGRAREVADRIWDAWEDAVDANGQYWYSIRNGDALCAAIAAALTEATRREREVRRDKLAALMAELDAMMVEARKPTWEFACSDETGVYVHESTEPVENACLVNTHIDAQLSSIQVLVGALLDEIGDGDE
jgi:hypothetical protein